MKTMQGFICGNKIYQYKGWLFEYSMCSGPWPLKKDGELRKRAGRVFYDIIQQWENEPDKEVYRVGGGCVGF